jgi:hypothetical protein
MYYRYQTKPFLFKGETREDFAEYPTGFQGLVPPRAMNYCQSVQIPLGSLPQNESLKCRACADAVQNCLLYPPNCSEYLVRCSDDCILQNIVSQGCNGLSRVF